MIDNDYVHDQLATILAESSEGENGNEQDIQEAFRNLANHLNIVIPARNLTKDEKKSVLNKFINRRK